MKKIFITVFLFTFFMAAGIGQNAVLSLTGYVFNEATGAGISGHPVTAEIMTAGYIETYVWTTDGSGFYGDSIAVVEAGDLSVSTFDCLGDLHVFSDSFGPGNYSFNYDFIICSDSLPEGCNASFSYVLIPMGTNGVIFNNISSGNPTGWSWDFGDGNYTDEWAPIHEYDAPGTYSVCLTIWSSDSLCYDQHCQDVTVGFAGDCENNFWYETWTQIDFAFMGESLPVPADYYFWDFGDGNTGSGQTVLHSYGPDTYGIVTVTLSTFISDPASGDSCLAVSSQEVWVAAQGNDCVNIFSYGTLDGYTFTFTGEGDPPASAYIWDFGDGTTGLGQSIQHIYEPGYEEPLTVSLTTYHTLGGTSDTCIAFSSQQIVVGDSMAGCENFFWYYDAGDFTFHFSGASYPLPAYEYIWDFGDGQTGTGADVEHTFDPDLGEFFVVTLKTMTNDPAGDTCVALSSQEVWITSGEWDCENWIWYETWDFTTFTFYGEAFPYPADVFYWDLGDGTTASGPEYTHSYSAEPGTILPVTLTTVAFDPATGDSCLAVSVLDIIIGGDSTGCDNTFWYESTGDYTFEFYAEAFPFPTDLYFWDFGDGSTATGQNVTHTYEPTSGELFYVCLTTYAMESVGDSCIAVSCKELSLSGQSGQEIFGTVYVDNTPVDIALVGLFGADPDNVYYEFTLTEQGSGSYFFENIPEGDYYIFTSLTPQAEAFYDYFPTYYGDAIFWFDAELISFGEPSNPYDINLVPIAGNASGPCSITGTVSMEDGKAGPGENIAVMLMDFDENPMNFTQTNESGSFVFEELAYGTYKLKVEMPGVNSETAVVELTESSLSSDIHFYVHNNSATLGISGQLMDLAIAGEIYPNPVSDIARVNVDVIERTAVMLQVINQTGQVVMTRMQTLDPGSRVIEIETASLTTGLYHLQILGTNGNFIARKFIK